MAPRSRGTVYIDARAKPGGNGTQNRPYRHLGEAMDAEEERKDRTYIVAGGSYEEFLKHPRAPKKRGRPKKKREQEPEPELDTEVDNEDEL